MATSASHVGGLTSHSSLNFVPELTLLFLAGAGFPVHVEDLIRRPEMVFRCAVAVEAPFHALRLVLIDHPHLVDSTVAGIAAHAPVYMDRVVEVGVVRNSVNLHPVDGGSVAFAAVPGGAHRVQSGILRLDLLVTSHARLHRWDIRMRGYLHETMAIPAVHTKLLHVKIMLKGHRLRWLDNRPAYIWE